MNVIQRDCPPELRPGEVIPCERIAPWLKSCGSEIKVYAGCRLVHPERISIGNYSQIDEGVYIFAADEIIIGKHVHLAFGSSISGGGKCVIRDFAGIGAGVRLVTGTDLIDAPGLTNPTVPMGIRAVQRGCIEIGSHAIVFTNSIVLHDVVIGEGAVIAAGSIVHHDVKPWGIYAGNPLVQVGVRPKDIILRLADRLQEQRKP